MPSLLPDAVELALGEPRHVLAVDEDCSGLRAGRGRRSVRSSVLLPEPLPPRITEMRPRGERAGEANGAPRGRRTPCARPRTGCAAGVRSGRSPCDGLVQSSRGPNRLPSSPHPLARRRVVKYPAAVPAILRRPRSGLGRMRPPRIELGLRVPETLVISVSLRARGASSYYTVNRLATTAARFMTSRSAMERRRRAAARGSGRSMRASAPRRHPGRGQ